jgi:hypothetical protein
VSFRVGAGQPPTHDRAFCSVKSQISARLRSKILRVFGPEDDLTSCKRYVAPPQVEQLALSTAGLEGSKDQCLEVRFCRAQEPVLLAWLQPLVPLRFFLATN